MQNQTALILGASGLIGHHLLQILLESSHINKVRALVRHSLDISHPKLEQIIIDFNDLDKFKESIGKGDFIFSCIGTTMKKVKGDKNLYKKIDFDIPVNAARFGLDAGYKKFLLVSAHLANSNSLIFYNRLKGETEEIISTFPFEAIHIFRPSFLIGQRKESRLAELTVGKFMQYISPLLPSAYKPILAATVAKAMLSAALTKDKGIHYHSYQQIIANSN